MQTHCNPLPAICPGNAEALPKSREEWLTLSEAAAYLPGRPSVNCIWRWCRRGVLGRNGVRVRLQHIRIGGKIFTSREWIADFTRQLAESDAAYFDAKIAHGQQAPPRAAQFAAPKRPRQRKQRRAAEDPDRAARVRQELDHEGL